MTNRHVTDLSMFDVLDEPGSASATEQVSA